MEAFANVENPAAVLAMKKSNTVILKTANVNVQKMLMLACRNNFVSMKDAKVFKFKTESEHNG